MNDPRPPSNGPSAGLRGRLAHWLGVQPTPRELVEAISTMTTAIEALTQSSADERAALSGVQERVERLEKEQSRTGREQYKANLLSEAQQQSVKDTLEQLRQTEIYRDRELTALRDQLTGAYGKGRLEVAQQLFPVIDGLDEALANGHRWLAQISARGIGVPRAGNSRTPLLGRLFGQTSSGALSEPDPEILARERLKSWIAGLELVRERLLDILAAQGIASIETDGENFDPRWQVAVETSSPGAGQLPGQIVQTQRRGFRREETVLRYAEVVVAREAVDAAQNGSEHS
jgi:molecular chaperone GrpE (heat shock protein)